MQTQIVKPMKEKRSESVRKGKPSLSLLLSHTMPMKSTVSIICEFIKVAMLTVCMSLVCVACFGEHAFVSVWSSKFPYKVCERVCMSFHCVSNYRC